MWLGSLFESFISQVITENVNKTVFVSQIHKMHGIVEFKRIFTLKYRTRRKSESETERKWGEREKSRTLPPNDMKTEKSTHPNCVNIVASIKTK